MMKYIITRKFNLFQCTWWSSQVCTCSYLDIVSMFSISIKKIIFVIKIVLLHQTRKQYCLYKMLLLS